jgi:hypothetical protein
MIFLITYITISKKVCIRLLISHIHKKSITLNVKKSKNVFSIFKLNIQN